MRHVLFAMLALAAILSASVVEAQAIPSPFRYVETSHSLGLRAGYLNTSTGDTGVGPEPSAIVGPVYTIRLTGPLTGMVGISMLPTSRTIFERVTIAADSVELEAIGEADLLLLLGEAGLRFNVTGPRTWNGLAPYVGASLGFVGNVRSRPALEEELEASQRVSVGPGFALGLSAGTDWFLTERFSIRAEAVDYLWRVTTPEGLSTAQSRQSQWTNNLGLTFGAALHF
jgi:hypothetical protein